MCVTRILLLLFLFQQEGVKSVRIVELRVPTHEREGGSALLGCQYEMEGDTLYSLKWYKDDIEFYRYAPSHDPPIQHFDRAGVNVDVAKSSGTVVALANLTRDSAGMYACEVSGEAPAFQYERSEQFVTIHLIPNAGPTVTGVHKKYFLDDPVFANCTSVPSRPSAQLKWLINDKPAPGTYLRGPWNRVAAERDDAVETTLELRFTVGPAHFVDGVMRLTCQSTIAPFYQQETTSRHYLALPFITDTTSPITSQLPDDAVKTARSLSSLTLAIISLIAILYGFSIDM